LGLLNILFLIIILYFLYNVIKGVWIINSKMRQGKDRKTGKPGRQGDDRVIELDKDQYKVE